MYKIFKDLMEEYGITAYKVSKETGIATSTLSDWKSGRSTPKQDKLQKIADYFNVSLDYLAGNKEKEISDNVQKTEDKLDILEDDMKILFSKAQKLSKEDRKKVLKMMEIFEDENNN